MELTTLTAISPVDGRYRSKCENLDNYFSEYALIRYRVKAEIEYFIALCEIPLEPLRKVDHHLFDSLRKIYEEFSLEDATEIKQTESVTNHDVKAVEYFIKKRFDTLGLEWAKEFVHFGLTSQDINNTSFPMMLRDALDKEYIPLLTSLCKRLSELADMWRDIPMLARTHGQPASPTHLGKEIEVFSYRLRTQLQQLETTPLSGKFGGATGNFNAHKVAFPDINWPEFGNMLLKERFNIERESVTTQISNYDNLAAIFHALERVNTIILDLDRDIWQYISMNYFKQRIKAGEVGSSAMPHKVNPIDFENSEGNLGIANAILSHLASKLPISRLQRDLTDSTVLRNLGVPLAHIEIAVKSTLKGLDKLILNEVAIHADLDDAWNVVAEGIQTILRREGYPNPYETLKALTRVNTTVTAESIASFIDTLEVADSVKEELRALAPTTYTGYNF